MINLHESMGPAGIELATPFDYQINICSIRYCFNNFNFYKLDYSLVKEALACRCFSLKTDVSNVISHDIDLCMINLISHFRVGKNFTLSVMTIYARLHPL